MYLIILPGSILTIKILQTPIDTVVDYLFNHRHAISTFVDDIINYDFSFPFWLKVFFLCMCIIILLVCAYLIKENYSNPIRNVQDFTRRRKTFALIKDFNSWNGVCENCQIAESVGLSCAHSNETSDEIWVNAHSQQFLQAYSHDCS